MHGDVFRAPVHLMWLATLVGVGYQLAVVALAVWGMAAKLCPDTPRRVLALGVAAAAVLVPGTLCQLVTIVVCGLVGSRLYATASGTGEDRSLRARHFLAASALVAYGALLVALPVAVRLSSSRPLALFDSFYRAGSLVFGGGHVVLPLLRSELVPRGWIGDDAFLAGYGAVQAVPGPLFTFAGYLGTEIHGAPHAWTGGLLALFAIFLPAWLLAGGAYPFWHLLRGTGWAQGVLAGANAAVVGILFAALYRPVCTEGIRGSWDVVAAAAAAVLLARFKAPPWLVVLLLAAAGQWILP